MLVKEVLVVTMKVEVVVVMLAAMKKKVITMVVKEKMVVMAKELMVVVEEKVVMVELMTRAITMTKGEEMAATEGWGGVRGEG